MANRYTNQFRASLEKRVSSIFMHVTFGAAGAPTLDTTNSKGIVSITRNSAGVYTIVFGTDATHLDTYVKLLAINKVFMGAADLAMRILANNISSSSLASIQVSFGADPTAADQLYMEFVMGDSSAP